MGHASDKQYLILERLDKRLVKRLLVENRDGLYPVRHRNSDMT